MEKLIRYAIKFILIIFHHSGPIYLQILKISLIMFFIPMHLGVSYSKYLTHRFLRINTEIKKLLNIQFEVITPMAMNMTLHILMEVYRRFGGTYSLHPQVRRVRCVN
jgi:hypothetical protein